MRRADRRRFEKEFRTLIDRDSEACTLCRRPFEHNNKTYGGLTPGGRTVLTGDCCREKVEYVMASGVYVIRKIHEIPIADRKSIKRLSSSEMEGAVEVMHDHFDELDSISGRVMKQAGLKGEARALFLEDTAWKKDDAAWFKNNPDRSHRLRPMFESEASSLPEDVLQFQAPKGHKMEVLVRQVEVGKRARTLICRNTEIPIPDLEEVIHALFDTVSQRKDQGVITAEEIASLARSYVISPRGKGN
ncbi:hypothetical protein [Rhizobium jaguaris]|uniref:Uncharacterized protein n=1 Tax=Rhizobium jaguaris TaxID=1312183 RepID=A0A387G9N0_9HYPH|nr:hypothetical protein [Rhizobium jaguaris]AYG64522.1 hypothetical protein CCGE525_38075 [Rhizobium jaguaris]